MATERITSWDDYRLIIALSRTAGLSKAALRLGLVPATVKARLAAIETRLGGRLFDSVGPGFAPTPLAVSLMPIAEALEASVDQFQAVVAGDREGDRGVVRVAAPELIGQHVMTPAFAALKRQHPDLTVEMVLVPGSRDEADFQADVACLPYVQDASEFEVTQAIPLTWGLYAHRDYIERKGFPERGADLTRFDLLGAASGSHGWFFRDTLGLAHDAAMFRFRSNSFTALFAALRAGLGVGQCQNPLAARFPELVRVVPEFSHTMTAYIARRRWLVGVRRVDLVHEAMKSAMSAYLTGAKIPQ